MRVIHGRSRGAVWFLWKKGTIDGRVKKAFMRGLILFPCSICIPGALLLLWTPPAHAYIDAGTASMLFQLLIAGALGLVFTVKVYWAQVKAFFSSRFRRDSSLDDESKL